MATWQFLRLSVVGAVSLAPFARAELPSANPGFTVQTWAHGADDPAFYNCRGAIVQTPDGYLWLGSPVGLVRFDGSRFFTLTTNDTPALGDNRISSLIVDQRGVLWIGTQAGTLCRRGAAGFSPVPVDPRLRGHPIESLAPAEDGGLWLGTAKWGLIRMVPGEEEFSSFTAELSSTTAGSLVKLDGDVFWGRVYYDLVKLGGGSSRGESIRLPPDAPRCYALAPSRSGKSLWLATSAGEQGPGARIFEVEDGRFVRELAPYPWRVDSVHSSVNCIAEDPLGRIWVSTALNGVFFWDPDQGWKELLSASRRPLNRISRFYFDGDGLLWMNDLDGRLFRVTEQEVVTVPLQTDPSRVIISAACVTRDGTLWVGTEGGEVYRFQDGGFVPVNGGLASLPVITLFEDSRATLFVGTPNGLLHWDGSRLQPTAADPITSNVIALHEDREGNLWVGSGNRIVQLRKNGDVRSYGPESGLGQDLEAGKGHSYIEGVAEDARGNLFVAQKQYGLYRLAGERFELADAWIPRWADSHLLQDADGSFWGVTLGVGLFRFGSEAFQSWGYPDGLPSPILCTGISDGAGNLWFGSNIGILGCSKRKLLDYQRGKSPPIPFWRLGEAEGMDGPRISGNSQSMVGRSADGRLWFPNGNVLAVFDPARIVQPWIPRAPIIEEIVADGDIHASETGNDTLSLASGLRRLQIHFTCPNSRSPEMLRFRYRLEGLEADWTETATERVAHYNQLKPGAYTFRIQVSGDSIEWKESLMPLALVIIPRWWERTPVRVLGFLSLTGLLLGAVWWVASASHRRRVGRLELNLARDQLTHLQRASSMGQLASTLAHEINQPLGAILRNAEAGELFLQQEPPDVEEVRAILADIRQDDQRAGAVIDRMRSLLKRRAPAFELVSLKALLDQVASLAKAEMQARRITLQVDVPTDLPAVKGDRVQLQQVLLNLCINAFNAMEDTPPERRLLAVRVCRGDGHTVEVAITDNGHGIPVERLDRVLQAFFSTKEDGLGMGLAIAQTIVAAHGGRIWAENNPEGGATFRFTLPIDNPGGAT